MPRWPERTLEERLLSRREVVGDCWVWTAARDREGYGKIQVAGTNRLTHRIAYEVWRGPIPPGLSIDHDCNNPSCFNPDHLTPRPIADNIRRGRGNKWSLNAAKTHCSHGHPFDEANTSVDTRGWRKCKTCAREAARRRRQHALEGREQPGHLL